jgi:hypothetical protein
MSETIKLTRDVPVVAECDVLVAGAGIAGCMAAIAAGREGARTIIVDRFGSPGGNMGPGMFSGGTLHLALGHKFAQPERLKGLPGEFIDRCEAYCDHGLGHDYFRDSHVASHVWLKMFEENNVRTMFNTCVGDPIMDGGAVKGMFIQNRGGLQAIRAKVTIDATGNAEVAARAGAPMFEGDKYIHPGMYFAIANVDSPKYLAWRETVQVSDDDVKWADEIEKKLGSWGAGFLKPFFPMMRRAWGNGEFRFIKPIGKVAAVTIDHGFWRPMRDIVGAQLGLADNVLHPGNGRHFDTGDQELMNELEVGCRIFIFEAAQFMHRYVPGFENSHLHMIAPYFHARGSRGVVCEHQLTKEESLEGARFDDVVMLTYENSAPVGSYDFPYRQMLPKNVKGLLATGKSAIVIPPNNRARWKFLVMGQASGVAAAMAAKANVTPAQVDIKELQRVLSAKYHMPLADNEARMKALGL